MAVRIESVELAQACESVDLACLTLISDAHQLYRYMYTDAAPALSASLRETKTARSGALVVHAGIALSFEPNLCMYTNLAQAYMYKSVHIVCFTSVPYSARAIRIKACSKDCTIDAASSVCTGNALSRTKPALCTCTNLTLEACESIQPLCVPHVVCDAQQLYADAAPVLSASIGV